MMMGKYRNERPIDIWQHKYGSALNWGRIKWADSFKDSVVKTDEPSRNCGGWERNDIKVHGRRTASSCAYVFVFSLGKQV